MEKIKKRNQTAQIIEAALEYFVSIMVAGAFLASILKNIGVSDSVTGIATSFIHLGCLAQFFAVLFLKPRTTVKQMVTIMHIVNQTMFVCLYLLPYFEIPQIIKTSLFIVLFLCASFINSAATPFRLSWMMAYVDDGERGIYTAKKGIISLVSGIVFSYLMGALIDYFEAIGKVETGFVLSGITLFVLAVLHTASLLAFKDTDEVKNMQKRKHSIKEILNATLLSKDFRKVIGLDVIWQTGTGLSISFFGTYQINELGFSLKYVAFLSALYSIVRAASSAFFGRFADRHSWYKMLILNFSFGALGFLTMAFTCPSNGTYMYVVYMIFYALCTAGSNGGMTNIAFDYTTHELRAQALGVKNAIGGVANFIAALVGARAVTMVQTTGNQLFGVTVYAQQLLSFVSFVILVCSVLYLKFVIGKLKKTV